MPKGRHLIEEIDATQLAAGELAFWWLGQHSFILKLARSVLYLDPFLSKFEGRTVSPLLEPADITNADFITGSHDHGDHIDRAIWPALAVASSEARFVAPRLVLDRGLAADLSVSPTRFIGLDEKIDFREGPLRITAVPAAHERLDTDAASGLHPYLGFIIEANGCRIYHAGDTCRYEGLETRLKAAGPFDVMFLPINGRDATRLAAGCIGNMTYQEAVDLAGELAPRLAVPAHFEMFAMNSEDPRRFTEYMRVKYPNQHTLIPTHGRRVILRGGKDAAPEVA
jgi:L-ascorbate metabolism protein UlaG (beta-lactamase superfamily)